MDIAKKSIALIDHRTRVIRGRARLGEDLEFASTADRLFRVFQVPRGKAIRDFGHAICASFQTARAERVYFREVIADFRAGS
jgi:hypothetical protein